MEILKTAVYKVDHDKFLLTLKPPEENEDLEEYLDDLVKRIDKGESKREFEFGEGKSGVKDAIIDIISSGDFDKNAQDIAQLFLKREARAVEETVNLKGEIPNGLLIQVLFRDDDGVLKMVISKSDNVEYLDEDDMKKHKGIPVKRKTYKAFMAVIEGNAIGKVHVYDTTTYLALYWRRDFLELEEVNTDEYNTGAAFDSIDQKVLNGIKKAHPADHNILKNRFIGYFKSSKEFEMDDFINQAIGDYDPDDPKFDVDDFKKRIRELPKSVGFDSQFTLAPEVIKARRLKNVVHLSEEIDLVIKDNLKDYNNVIRAVEEKGVKYIKIRTESGYKAFKKAEEES